MSEAKRPIRVLHGVGSLNRGGIETWLMNIIRQRSQDLETEFILGQPGGVYEAEAVALGCRLHHLPQLSPLRKRLHMVGLDRGPQLLQKLLSSGRYDVLHVHGDEFFGEAMQTAANAGVPVRVAHCHNTQVARGKRGPEMLIRRLRFRTMERRRTLRYATDIVACSSDAGRHFMGGHWTSDPRCQPVYCGVPLDHFPGTGAQWSRQSYRKAHGIPENAIVIGHAGSMDMTPQKNHEFLLRVFEVLAHRDERYRLYLAGDGPKRMLLEQKVADSGLQGRVFLPGLCSDVPALMVHGFDVHLLPSLFEGLPVVGLEAVASGLHTVCSETITRDFTGYFEEFVTTLSLQDSPEVWADRVAVAVDKRIPVANGLAAVKGSPFSVTASLDQLLSLYRSRLPEKL